MLVAAMLIVCWMVVYRALGNSTYWEIELATYLIVGAVLVGTPYGLKPRGHIGVDLVSEWLPPRGRRIPGPSLGMTLFAALGLAGWVAGLLLFGRRGVTADGVNRRQALVALGLIVAGAATWSIGLLAA